MNQTEHSPAGRVSPYAIAAFVLSVVSTYRLPSGLGVFTLTLSEIVRDLVPRLVVPLAGGAATLWLARRADEEISASRGRLTGAGFARTARVLAIVVLAAVPVIFALNVVFAEDPSSRMMQVPGPPEEPPPGPEDMPPPIEPRPVE